MSSAPTRPVIRYFGGKWRLAPWIIEHFPAHRVYVEPYGGAASVLLQKERSYAEVYNDMDGEVVNLFRVLRDPALGPKLRRLVHLTPYARLDFELAYQPSDDPLEQARRTIVKAFLGFGSNSVQADTPSGRGFGTRLSTVKPKTGFRSDSNRSGSTPARDWYNYPGSLDAVIDRLRGVVIEQKPALELIPTFDRAETLYYVDPPYPHGTRQRPRTDRYRHEMSDDDHRALAELLHGVKGMVVVSGYPCALYDDELFAGWERFTRPARADRQRDATEVLWLNPAAADRLQPSLFTPH